MLLTAVCARFDRLLVAASCSRALRCEVPFCVDAVIADWLCSQLEVIVWPSVAKSAAIAWLAEASAVCVTCACVPMPAKLVWMDSFTDLNEAVVWVVSACHTWFIWLAELATASFASSRPCVSGPVSAPSWIEIRSAMRNPLFKV